MTDLSTIKKLEQGRASFAFECAQRGAQHRQSSKYKSHVKKLPMMIKTNGLGASSAFAFSKRNGSDEAWPLLTSHIENWLVMKGILRQNENLHEKVITMPSDEYRALSVEVLAFLNWLRRFAEGLIIGDAEDND